MQPPWRLTVGLALGGGAARGVAHVGVVRALVREGIPIDLITGTSMGAIVGGAFAATGDPARIERETRRVLGSEEFRRTRLHFFHETRKVGRGVMGAMSMLLRRGIVYGMTTMRPSFLPAEEFADSIHAIVPDLPIESLEIPFAAVALDLEAGEEVLLRRGNLREACAASAAIPGVLPPRRLDGRTLVDGGWVDKIPVLPAFHMGADVVIAVDLSADIDDGKPIRSGIDVVTRANMIKDAVLASFGRRLADVIIEPAVKKVHWADFESADYCIQAGDDATVAAIPAIRDLLRHERWRSVVRPGHGKKLAELYLDSPHVRLARD